MSRPPIDKGRRRFTNWFLSTSFGALAASIVYPMARFISPPRVAEAATNEVEVGFTNDPELVANGFKIVPFGADPVIVVRVAEDEFRAFNAVCTHLDCIVSYRPDRELLWCYCHDGIYDLGGRNVGGPPPKPLLAYEVHLVSKGEGQPPTLVIRKS